jgi:hypothetical protein
VATIGLVTCEHFLFPVPGMFYCSTGLLSSRDSIVIYMVSHSIYMVSHSVALAQWSP